MNPYEIVLDIVLILTSVLLTAIVLFQEGRSAGLSGAIAGGAEQFLGKNKGKTIEQKLVKITKVLEVEPNPKEDIAPEAESVAIVVYEYTNDDIAHGLVIGNTHFKAYDSKGKELEQYPQKDLFEPSDVGTSGTFTASVAFALNNDDDYLKIEYYKDISAKKPDVVFEQEW